MQQLAEQEMAGQGRQLHTRPSRMCHGTALASVPQGGWSPVSAKSYSKHFRIKWKKNCNIRAIVLNIGQTAEEFYNINS